MTNLILYIKALQCISLPPLLQHAFAKNDTVYVSDENYNKAVHEFDNWYERDIMTIIDTAIHNKFKCKYFKWENPEWLITYSWDDKLKQYVND